MVFEKILEKILDSIASKYISGIDRNNLKTSIWQGNVTIKNVYLKPDLVDRMELPIKIKFSSIGRLSLEVPWRKLSSKPVEVVLENVFLVVAPNKESEWSTKSQHTFLQKSEIIEKYAKQCLQNFLDKELQKTKSDKDASYFDRLQTKIVDNL